MPAAFIPINPPQTLPPSPLSVFDSSTQNASSLLPDWVFPPSPSPMQRSASVVAVMGSSHEAQEGTGGAKVNWDNDRSFTGKSAHLLIEWLGVKNNWHRWKGDAAKKKAQLLKEAAAFLHDRGCAIRETTSTRTKITDMSRKFNEAMDFNNHTGQGIENNPDQSQSVNDEQLHRELLRIRKWWDDLLPIMGERAAANPGGLYHTGSNEDEARAAFQRKSGLARNTTASGVDDDDDALDDEDDCPATRLHDVTDVFVNHSQSSDLPTRLASGSAIAHGSQGKHARSIKLSATGGTPASQQRASASLASAERRGTKRRTTADGSLDEIMNRHEKTARMRFEDDQEDRKLRRDLEERRLELDRERISHERAIVRWKTWIESVATLVQAGLSRLEAEALAGPKPSLD